MAASARLAPSLTSVPPDSSRSTTFQRPELDILRFLAFALVFVYHALDTYPGPHTGIFEQVRGIGSRGVDLFFALSAYLITEILLRERRALGSINLRHFYVRRILRIWPLYYSFLLFSFFVVPHFRWQEHFPWKSRVLYLVFLGNWRGLADEPVNTVAAILWSVSVEEQFYLSWPLLVRGARRYHIPFCVGLLVLAVAYRGAQAQIAGTAADLATISRLDGIAAGALLAFVLDGRFPRLSPFGGRVLMLTGFLALAGHLISGWAAPIANTVVAGGCVMILIGSLSLGFRNSRLEYLGKISYGLYVFHLLALRSLVPHRASARLEWIGGTLAALALTIGLAAASSKWLEGPFLKLKGRFAAVRRA